MTTTTTEGPTMKGTTKGTSGDVRQRASGHTWGLQLRREMEILMQATNGVGAATLWQTIAAEAAVVDDGTLADSAGTTGYAWNPDVYERKGSADPVRDRMLAISASMGRVLCGGHPSHRAYLALLEAVYRVAVEQDYDTARRIEALWERARVDAAIAASEEQERQENQPRPGVLARVGRSIVRFLRAIYMLPPEQ